MGHFSSFVLELQSDNILAQYICRNVGFQTTSSTLQIACGAENRADVCNKNRIFT
jgi:hypothetical protein